MSETKVVHLTSAHPARDPRIFHKECRSLAEAGFETVLIAQHPKDEEADGVFIKALQCPRGRLERVLRTSVNAYRAAVAQNANVYHFHDPELIPLCLLLSARGKRVIYDVHEHVPRQILSKSYLPGWCRRPLAWSFDLFERLSAQFFDVVIAATPAIANRFARTNKRVVVVRNYPRVVKTISLPPWEKRPDAVVYAGFISRERGIVELVRAMGMLPASSSARLLLAGRFVNKALFDEVSRLPGWNRVDYRGVIDQSQIPALFGEARVGVVVLHAEPNYIDSLPTKLFEYLAAGLPVVASKFPLWEEIVGQSKAGILVDPLQPLEIMQAIECLLYSSKGAEIGNRGRAAVENLYKWDSEARQLIGVYEHLRGVPATRAFRAGSST